MAEPIISTMYSYTEIRTDGGCAFGRCTLVQRIGNDMVKTVITVDERAEHSRFYSRTTATVSMHYMGRGYLVQLEPIEGEVWKSRADALRLRVRANQRDVVEGIVEEAAAALNRLCYRIVHGG